MGLDPAAVQEDMVTTPTHGYTIRHPEVADLPAVQAVLDASESADTGEPCRHDVDVATYADTSKLDLEHGTWLVEAPDLSAAAAGWVWGVRDGDVELVGEHYVHPAHRGGPAEAMLVETIERRAAELAAGDAAFERLVLFSDASDGRRRRSLVTRGYAHARDFYGMRIDLGPGRPAQEWPAGIVTRAIRPGVDDRLVHAASEEAFSEHYLYGPTPFADWLRVSIEGERFDPSLWLVAWDGEEVAGEALAVPRDGDAYVEDLAVRKPWRGRGLGPALLLELFRLLGDRGLTPARLFVDVQNTTGALRVYERAGMRVERHIEGFERPLRRREQSR
jgi:mycothiol synthase